MVICFREYEYHGLMIRGFLHVHHSDNDKVIVMCHGFTGNKCDHHFMYVTIARRLCDLGYDVYRFDYLGSGDSDGTFYDNESIVDQINQTKFIIEKLGYVHTHLFGFSLGGVVVSHVAKDTMLDSLLLMSPAGNFKDIIDDMSDRVYGVDGFRYSKVFYNEAKAFGYFESLDKLNYPVHIVQGDKDELVCIDTAKKYQSIYGCDITWIKDANHTFTWQIDELVDDLIHFYK